MVDRVDGGADVRDVLATPLASVAMLEKFSLLKMALCSAACMAYSLSNRTLGAAAGGARHAFIQGSTCRAGIGRATK